MPCDADVLTLAQWLSPAYPVGAFAYSHGLESAVADGRLRGAHELEAWLHDVIGHGTGRSDCMLLGAAHRAAPAQWPEIDEAARAFAAGRERLLEAEAQGRAFAATTNAIWDLALPPLVLPVAVGAAAGLRGLPAPLTGAMYLQAMASNLLQAAQRLAPIGQTAGQRILAHLTPLCRDVSGEAVDAPLDSLSSAAFLSDIAAMRHEPMEPRIFRT
ncbi:urease accessory protein UreF [Sediminimonas qiaohouensis]|uniref:urease accessory protein UreF n=1 Tax=Sediminimonas qiaohouensis TaxID=552061 RepID=UPI00047B2CFE|nr:urease accessory UreF family protein [Sediminimonas qiaohouensis]